MYAINNNYRDKAEYSLDTLLCNLCQGRNKFFLLPMIAHADVCSAFEINGFIFVLTKHGEITRSVVTSYNYH